MWKNMDTEWYRMLKVLVSKITRSLRSIINHPKNLIGTTSIWNAIPTRLCVPPISGPMCWEQCSSGWLPESEGVVTKMRGPHKHGYQGGKKNIKWWGMNRSSIGWLFFEALGCRISTSQMISPFLVHVLQLSLMRVWRFGMYCALFIRKSNQQQSKVQYMKVVCCLIGTAYRNMIWSPSSSLCKLAISSADLSLAAGLIVYPGRSIYYKCHVGIMFPQQMLLMGTSPAARAQKKRCSTYCIYSTMVPFFRQRHYTHRTWLYIELGKAGHVWLKTSENITCLHRCISYTCWICSSHREFPKVLGPRTHCACGLCNQEFWGPKISGPVKDAEMR